MRTVLIGSDFMYNPNGDLIPIEINTNLGWDNELQRIEKTEDVFDLAPFLEFVSTNGFTKIHYIGAIYPFFNKLSQSLDIECNFHYMEDGLTIPDIEDNDTTLIIRSAYDSTALVDEFYCANKVNFLNLISSSTFGSEFAYKDGATLVNTITTIPDNGVHPNFILKAIIPHYDKDIYPKLFKVSNQSELNTIMKEVDKDYFLMPYHYNPDKLYENHIQVVRSFNLLFPPDLNSISMGAYHKLCINEIDSTPAYDSDTHIYTGDRNRYLTTPKPNWEPKLEDGDLVEMADGTFKTALELEVGDELKTIDIPNPFNIDSSYELGNYRIAYDTLNTGATYTTNRVTNKDRVHKSAKIVTIEFTDGTNWRDVGDSYYLIERDGEIRFFNTGGIKEGDILILINTINETQIDFVQKIVSSTTSEMSFFSGWTISVERRHLFLTKSGEDVTTSFVAIEHNRPGSCNCVPGGGYYGGCWQCNIVCGKNQLCAALYTPSATYVSGTCNTCY